MSLDAADAEAPRGDHWSAGVLGALGVWAALHLVTAPLVAEGTRLAVVLLADALATAAVTVLVVLGDRLTAAFPHAATVVLAAGGALAGVSAAAAGRPLVGLDAGLWVLAGAFLLGSTQLVVVATVTAVPWAVAGGYGLVHQVRLDSGGPLGSAAGWAHGSAALCGAAIVAFAVRRGVEAQLEVEQTWRARVQDGAVSDQLTGAANRAGADLIARPMIEHARRSGQAVNCLYIDVDGVRLVNEAVGLAGGDAVLEAVARVVTDSVRGTDLVCRWTGDEFVVVGPGTGMSPLELERRVRASLLSSPPVPTEVWTGKVSIGSATLVPWDEGDLSSLVAKAEKDMQLRRQLRRQTRERSDTKA